MKNTFFTIVLALLSLLFFPNISFGQLYEVSLDEKIEKSTLIVEGKVVETKCFRIENGDIYTANKIEVASLLKGQFQNRFLTVTTWGGELDDEIQTWTHLLTLDKGDYGLFFLEPTRTESVQDADFPESFDVFAGSQGFLAFSQNESKVWVASEPFHSYSNLETDLFEPISRKTGQKLTIVNPVGREIRNGIRYHFTNIAFNGTDVTFNINVNSLIGNKKLYKSGIQIGYNSDFFGSNIATNGNLVMQNLGISSSSTYSLAQSNVTSNKVKLELLPVGAVVGLTEINGTEQLLAKGKISIVNLLANPNITYDIAQMQAMSKFYEGGLAQVFDTVIVEGNLSPFGDLLAASIDSIRPLKLRAGTDDLLTIYGHKFGASQGSSIVQFTNAFSGITNGVEWINPLKPDYKTWSDTLIKVFVPSVGLNGTVADLTQYAGTGKIRVKVGSSSAITSAESIKVRLAADNRAISDNGATELKRKKVQLISDFGENNGYTLYYDQSFKDLAGARSAFERALCTWIQSSNVNFRVKNYADIDPTYQGYACQIALTDNFPVGVDAITKAYTSKTYYADCLDGNGNVLKVGLKKFDILFRKSATWFTDEYYDPMSPLAFWIANRDLESFAIHELGHAQLLLHVNQTSDVMYYLVEFPNRTLKTGDIEGGTYIRDLSTINDPNCGFHAIVPLTTCGSTSAESSGPKIEVTISPNPSFETVEINCDQNMVNLIVFNNLGQEIVQKNGLGNGAKISTLNWQKGIYFFKINTKNNSTIIKVEKI